MIASHASMLHGVIDALLDSVAPLLADTRMVDLTEGALSGPWLRRRHAAESNGPGREDLEPPVALVLADLHDIERAQAAAGSQALLLLRAPFATARDDGLAEIEIPPGWRINAKVRESDAYWLLLSRTAPLSSAYALSLVVTCRDDDSALFQLCDYLAQSQHAFAWEMVIVDRGSLDRTHALIRGLSGDVQTLHVHRSASFARAYDTGIRSARAPVCLLTTPSMTTAVGRGLLDPMVRAYARASHIVDSPAVDTPAESSSDRQEGWWGVLGTRGYLNSAGFAVNRPWPAAFTTWGRASGNRPTAARCPTQNPG